MAEDTKRSDSVDAPNPQDNPPAVENNASETDAMEVDFWTGMPIRKGLPLKNRLWQRLAHDVKSFAWPVGFVGRYLRELPGPHYNAKGYNIYFDWLFLISDEPITDEQLKPTTNKSKIVDLGHGEFVTRMQRQSLGFRLWGYANALHEEWGITAEVRIQQFVIDTGERRPPRVRDDVVLGPLLNARRLRSPLVHPSECDPDLLDPDERDSPSGRLLVMHMKGGPTPAQADRVVEQLRSYDDEHERRAYLMLATLAIVCYRDIAEVLKPKLEEAMADLEEVIIATPEEAMKANLPYVEPEELERFESLMEGIMPDAVLRQTRWVREAEAHAQEAEAHAQEAEAHAQEAEAHAQEAEARLRSERVDTLVSFLARRDAKLLPEEVAELKARSIDELPSVEAALNVTTREEFLELAKLNGHAPPSAPDTNSDE